MKYIGIDQHKRHLTLCVRNEQGDIVLRRQVSTAWKKIDRFLEELRCDSGQSEEYAAIRAYGRGIRTSSGVVGQSLLAWPSCVDCVKRSGTCSRRSRIINRSDRRRNTWAASVPGFHGHPCP